MPSPETRWEEQKQHIGAQIEEQKLALGDLFYSRKILFVLIVLLQVALLLLCFVFFAAVFRYVYGVMVVLAAVLCIYELNRQNEEAGFKISWILLVTLLPLFGWFAYLLMHFDRTNRRIRSNADSIASRVTPLLARDRSVRQALAAQDATAAAFGVYCEQAGGGGVYDATETVFYPDGLSFLAALLEALEQAERFIFLEYFIINHKDRMWREILDVLRRKAAAGVEVRVVYDGLGSAMRMPGAYAAQLRRAGLHVSAFAPVVPLISTHQNNRDHHKIAVIDGRVAFNGGINLADEYINERDRGVGFWEDTAIRYRGPAVQAFTAMFLEIWHLRTVGNEDYERYLTRPEPVAAAPGWTIPFAASPLSRYKTAERAYIDLINTATDHLYLTTPYLCPPYGMLEALKYAAQRGVEVDLLLPGRCDKRYSMLLARSYYPELMKAGIRIFEFQPGFIHAKGIMADGRKAVAGTINLDYRSLYLHYECGVYQVGTAAVAAMEQDFQRLLAQSRRVDLEQYFAYPKLARALGQTLRLVAPLL